jgi:hypothetical protein
VCCPRDVALWDYQEGSVLYRLSFFVDFAVRDAIADRIKTKLYYAAPVGAKGTYNRSNGGGRHSLVPILPVVASENAGYPLGAASRPVCTFCGDCAAQRYGLTILPSGEPEEGASLDN